MVETLELVLVALLGEDLKLVSNALGHKDSVDSGRPHRARKGYFDL